MKCISCGRELPDGAFRCPGCDTIVRRDDLANAVDGEYHGDRVDEFISQIDIDYGDDNRSERIDDIPVRTGGSRVAVREPSRIPWVKIAIAAAALILVAVCIFFAARSCSAQPGVTPTPTPDASENPSTELTIDMTTLALESGDTYKLTVTSSMAEGEFTAPEWSSSAPDIASVDTYGVVTAHLPGEAIITASVGGHTASCTVTVEASEFSEWTETLPAGISSATHDIESARFYVFREKELTTSTETELEGWTVYETAIVAGEFGEWSEWQTTPISANQTREVETRTEYSQRTLITPAVYGEWEEWGYWQPNRLDAPRDTTQEECRTTYRYFYYVCPRCSTRTPIPHCSQITCGFELGEMDYVEAWSDISYAKAPRYDWDGKSEDGKVYYRTVVDQSTYFFEDITDDNTARTEYRYRTRSCTPAVYSEWTEWTADVPAGVTPLSDASVETRTRTVYRSRVMATQELGFFWRWGEWSEPVEYASEDESFVSGEDIEFKDITLYRYREK